MNKKLYWALISLFSVIFLVSAIYIGRYLIDYYRSQQQLEELQNMHAQPSSPSITLRPATSEPSGTTEPTGTAGTITLPTLPGSSDATLPNSPGTSNETTGSGMLSDMDAFYQLNSDVVGYIYIPGTRVNNPVMQRPSEKDYYLYRDFYGDDNRNGSIYVREACDVFAPSDNVTIYGHNMANGSMFADLHKYKDKDFFDAHPLVYFDTLYERHVYQVVCIFRTSGTYGVGFPFHLYDNFEDKAEYSEFINGVRDLAIYDSGISVSYGDKFICLSTCEDWPITNGRLVLLAVRIS